MESEMLTKALEALLIMSDPIRLMYLAGGVLIGLGLGVIPGLGGIVGLALLLPFTFDLDPFAAFGFLLGMQSVTTTSDTIPAVLFGVPGTTGSAATILDGHPMAKQGQAGRAFGAAYTASMFGGLFGALLLAVSIPILRPVMLYLGSPELLSFSVFGLCMVAVLSSGSPLRGLVVAGFGLMVAMIGSDPQTGTMRWTFDAIYLWDGLPIVPITLGLFALPELADMAIAKKSIAGNTKIDSRSGQWEGVKDTFRHWWLVVRCAWLGAALGAVPGIGVTICDWVAYGHAARTEKGASETFGKGDIRGVLASEGANNAKEGGSLVPTIAFGVPGSSSMAILLGAFLIHGLQPGPDMLTKDLNVTYAIIWSVALANILGTAICFGFSNQFAKIAIIRAPIILPMILTVIFIGAFQGSRSWGDLFALMFFGILGWVMKRLGWPRPPLILGVVLGSIVERYLFISITLSGADWLLKPVVMVVLAVSLWGLVRPFMREIRTAGGLRGMFTGYTTPRANMNTVLYAAFLILFVALLYEARDWPWAPALVPKIVGFSALVVLAVSLLNHTFRRDEGGGEQDAGAEIVKSLHLDLKSDQGDMDNKTVALRAAIFLGWLLLFLGSTAMFGMLPTIFGFVILYMRLEGNERWRLVLPVAAGLSVFSYVLFDQLLSLPWPHSVLGDWFPVIRDYLPSV